MTDAPPDNKPTETERTLYALNNIEWTCSKTLTFTAATLSGIYCLQN